MKNIDPVQLDEICRADIDPRHGGAHLLGMELRGPYWLRELVGRQWFEPLARVNRIEVNGSGLVYLQHFSHLESVTLVGWGTNEQLQRRSCCCRTSKVLNMERAGLGGLPGNPAAYPDPLEEGQESFRIPALAEPAADWGCKTPRPSVATASSAAHELGGPGSE